jgi:hypothetical protein
MLSVSLKNDAPQFVRECAVNVAAVLGFRSVSMEFPILQLDAQVSVREDDLVFLVCGTTKASSAWSIKRNGPLVELEMRNGEAAREMLYALLEHFSEIEGSESFELDSCQAARGGAGSPPSPVCKPGLMESGYHSVPAERGLESLFEREFLVKDEDFDFLPDRIDATIELPVGFDDDELSAACDLAARFGMESLGIELPLLGSDDGKRPYGNVLRIERAEDVTLPVLLLTQENDKRVVSLRGRGSALAAMASALCNTMPGTGDDSLLAEIRDGLVSVYAAGGSQGDKADLVLQEKLMELKGDRIDLPWELDECHTILAREVYPRIVSGQGTEILVVIGEDLEVRRALEAEIREACQARGAESPRIRVIGAFKQGFSWLRDYELTELAACDSVGSIDIGFSAFLPEGRPAWSDEDGTTPRIAPNRPDDPSAWLDPPIRLLQELYPIDDILADELGINRDRIMFSLHREATEAPGYTLIVRDGRGGVVYESAYTPVFSERPYLDDFPGLGKVHPGTGLVRLSQRGATIWESHFKTDMEAVWDAYQSKVLPAAREIAQAVKEQPFFSRLIVEVEASEPDEALPCRHDRLSSLESLHEDLYFAGLDYFQIFGVKTTGIGYDSPGLILPIIRKRSGAPKMHYSIQADGFAAGAKTAGSAFGSPPTSVFVDELAFDEASGRFSSRFCLRFEDSAVGRSSAWAGIERYARLLSRGEVSLPQIGRTFSSVRFALDGDEKGIVVEAQLPEPQTSGGAFDIAELEFPKDRLIDSDEFETISESLAKTKGIRHRLVGRSRESRPIFAIELLPQLSGYISRTKLIATRPTLYVNGRHHANEVSSTNSSLMFIKKLLSDPVYADLSEHLNIVVVPLENVDGAAIHSFLAHDNPEWMLHAARYDSLGGEFARDYFNDVTAHPEALAFTRIWRDWLPDVVADDHGVPSHEWCQQFSGYTSPWFKGFWMPRALLYGYFWYVTDEAYAANKLVAERIEEVVAAAMGAQDEFALLNAEWRDRFEKYAHAWMPKLFPAEYYKDMIFYWVPYPYKPDYYYVAVRFPWITAVSFVSEVADETATGDYLELCARAHLEEDLAIVKLLSEAEVHMDESVWIEDDVLCARRVRKRPLELTLA